MVTLGEEVDPTEGCVCMHVANTSVLVFDENLELFYSAFPSFFSQLFCKLFSTGNFNLNISLSLLRSKYISASA